MDHQANQKPAFKRQEHGQFEKVKQGSTKTTPSEKQIKTITVGSVTSLKLQRMARRLVNDSRQELQRTKTFLRDKEQREAKNSNGQLEAGDSYIPNADLNMKNRLY